MPVVRVRPAPPKLAQELAVTINNDVPGWVARAQAGDRAAFGLIYGRYVDQVFQFVYSRVKNRQVAEDLTSETFERALRGIDAFVWRGTDFGAWLVTIARNITINYMRSGRYRYERPVADIYDADRADLRAEADPARAAIDRLTNEAVLAGVRQLGREQRQCIALRYLRGLTLAETAQVMGKTESAVKTLQHRALKALRGLLPAGVVMPA